MIPKLAVFAAAKGGLRKRGFVAKEHQFEATTSDYYYLLLTKVGAEALASRGKRENSGEKNLKACQLKIKHFEIHQHLILPGASKENPKGFKG